MPLRDRHDPPGGHPEDEMVVGKIDDGNKPIDTQRDCFPLKLGVKGKRNVAM